jgi:hypothetical protein
MVARVPKPCFAVTRPHHAPDVLRDLTKSRFLTDSQSTKALLDQCPGRLDRIEVWRVWWKEDQLSAAALDQDAYESGLVGEKVVHDDDVVGAQFWSEASSDPIDEGLRVCGTPGRTHGQPTVES